MAALVLEILLGAGLVFLAIRLLWRSDPLESIVLFVVFGTLLTLLWAWLGAVDLALAEATVGTGLTGALLLAAWANAHGRPRTRAESHTGVPWVAGAVAASGAGLGFMLQGWLSSAAPEAAQLAAQLEASLPQSGVDNPVTAVLLNFRGYDTLLEVVVLTAAWLAAFEAPDRHSATGDADIEDRPAESDDILSILGRLWLPLVLVVSLYLVWAGGHRPGGAFQSAALIAGTGVLLYLVGVRAPLRSPPIVRALVPVAGLALFALVAAGGLLSHGTLLFYPEGQAGAWILALELTMTLSLAALLHRLYRQVFHHRRLR